MLCFHYVRIDDDFDRYRFRVWFLNRCDEEIAAFYETRLGVVRRIVTDVSKCHISLTFGVRQYKTRKAMYV